MLVLTVSRITQKKGNTYEAVFSSGERLLLSEDMLVSFRLLKGAELSEEQLEEIRKKAGYDAGLQLGMNYLSYQIRSEKEMNDYLKEKGIGAKDRQSIIRRLAELSLINDEVFGESYVRTQMRLSDKGPQFLAQQLKQKGLTPEHIEHALSLYSLSDQLEIAVKTGEKFLKKTRRTSYRESQQKLKMHLMKKGFAKEVIDEAVNILQEEPDEDAEYESLCHQGEKIWLRQQKLEPARRNQKIKQQLYQKGFSLDQIQRFLDEKEEEA